jgi:hypothetical protein
MMLWLMVSFLVGFIAQGAAFIFLGLVWTTRRQRNIASMFFFKTGYFIFNPLLRPAGLSVLGRRYRLAAIACFVIMITVLVIALSLAQSSLTTRPS